MSINDLALPVMVIARISVFGLGAALTLFSIRAYRRTRARYIRTASIGFGVITVGVFLEGGLYHVGGVDLIWVHVVESIAISIGFLVVLLSLRR